MSERPELKHGEDGSSDEEDLANGWLEQIASQPDAIWDEASTEPVDDRATIYDDTDRPQAHGLVDDQADFGPADTEELAKIAARLAPTVQSPRATRNQVESLVRALELEERRNSTVDKPGNELNERLEADELLADRPTTKVAPGQLEEDDSAETAAEDSSELASPGVPEYSEELVVELDDLMWLDEMEKVPEMKANSQDDDERLPVNEANSAASGDSEPKSVIEPELEVSADDVSDQVPEDPDEAIAWLERLAARQGAPAEELPTVKVPSPVVDSVSELEEGVELHDMDAGDIPEDPDEAMAWLEMLAAREGATPDVEITGQASGQGEDGAPIEAVSDAPTAESLSADLDEALGGTLPSGIDEALDWLEELAVEPAIMEDAPTPVEPLAATEEPPTPAVAHDVAEALAGAELLFAEPERVESIGDTDQTRDELQYDEAEDAMAWLEQLAARQGAPIEELTTVDSTVDEPEQDDLALEEVSIDDVEPGHTASDGESPTYVQDQVDVEVEQPVAETVDEATLLFDSPSAEADHEAVEIVDASLEQLLDVEPETVEPELESQPMSARDEVEAQAEPERPAEDLAWLDTLGAVDAEKWLEAEAADHEEKVAGPIEHRALEELAAEEETFLEERADVSEIVPAGPGSEMLLEARQAMADGELDVSLTKYAELVEEGQLLAFLIDDLETLSEQRGPEPGLQRILGDAYARNGQLRRALESYRVALANL